jgi:hypothetical protein
MGYDTKISNMFLSIIHVCSPFFFLVGILPYKLKNHNTLIVSNLDFFASVSIIYNFCSTA